MVINKGTTSSRGTKMNGSFFKIAICVLVTLFMVFSPMALSIKATPSGLAYAQNDDDQGQDYDGDRHSSSPEPATWLLLGSALGGAALYRKIRKK